MPKAQAPAGNQPAKRKTKRANQPAPNIRPEWLGDADARHWFDATNSDLMQLWREKKVKRQPGHKMLYARRALEKQTGRKPIITHVSTAAAVAFARRLGRKDVNRATLRSWNHNGKLPCQPLSPRIVLHEVARLIELCSAPKLDNNGRFQDADGKWRVAEKYATKQYGFATDTLRAGLERLLGEAIDVQPLLVRYHRKRGTYESNCYLERHLQKAAATRDELFAAAREPRPHLVETVRDDWLFADEFAAKFGLPEDRVRRYGNPKYGCPFLGGCDKVKVKGRNVLRPDPIRTARLPRKCRAAEGEHLRLQTAFYGPDGKMIKRNLARGTTAPEDYIRVTEAAGDVKVSASNYLNYRLTKNGPLGVQLRMKQYYAAGRGREWGPVWHVHKDDHDRLKAAQGKTAPNGAPRSKKQTVHIRRCNAERIAHRRTGSPARPSDDQTFVPLVDLAAELNLKPWVFRHAISDGAIHCERRPRDGQPAGDRAGSDTAADAQAGTPEQPETAATAGDAQRRAATGRDPEALYPPADLCEELPALSKKSPDARRQWLRRFRRDHPHDFEQVADADGRQAQFRYRLSAVRDAL